MFHFFPSSLSIGDEHLGSADIKHALESVMYNICFGRIIISPAYSLIP